MVGKKNNFCLLDDGAIEVRKSEAKGRKWSFNSSY